MKNIKKQFGKYVDLIVDSSNNYLDIEYRGNKKELYKTIKEFSAWFDKVMVDMYIRGIEDATKNCTKKLNKVIKTYENNIKPNKTSLRRN